MVFYGLHFSLPPEADPLPFPNVIEPEAPQRLEPLFKNLYEAYRQKGYLYEWRQTIFLQQILCEVFTILHTKQEPISTARIRKALAYIHENPCSPLALEDLLKRICLLRRWLKNVALQTLFISAGALRRNLPYLPGSIGTRSEYNRKYALRTFYCHE